MAMDPQEYKLTQEQDITNKIVARAMDLEDYLTLLLVAKQLPFDSFINYCDYIINKYNSEEITTEVKEYLDKYYPVSYFEQYLDVIMNDIKSFKEIPFIRTSRKKVIELLADKVNTYVVCPTNNIEIICLIFNENGVIKTSYLGGGNYGNYWDEKMKRNMAEISVDENDERNRVYTDLRIYAGLKSFINDVLINRKKLQPLF